MLYSPYFWLLFLIISIQSFFYLWLETKRYQPSKQTKLRETLVRQACRYGLIINLLILVADIWVFSSIDSFNLLEGILAISVQLGTIGGWIGWQECNNEERCQE